MIIIMLGAPGSGKGTQAALISEKYAIPRISTGDIFRINIQAGTKLGVIANEYIEKGLLVPDEVTNEIVRNRISEQDCSEGFILDGYPRTMDQVKSLERMLKKMDREVAAVLNLAIPDEEVLHRLSGRRVCQQGHTYHVAYNPPEKEGICDKCGEELYIRDDDKLETVKQRLKEYHKKSDPLIKYYCDTGVLLGVDGKQTPEEVGELISELLKDRGYPPGGKKSGH